MASKTNPRKIPATQADVKKAWGEGRDFAIHLMTGIVLYTLLSRCGYSVDEVQRIGKETSSVSEAIRDGYMTIHDIEKCLKEENDITWN